jgi:hypothetical protein
MYFVDFHGLKTQDYTFIITFNQEYSPELSIALDPPKESQLNTL